MDQSSADEAYGGVTAALNAAKKKGRTAAKRPSGSAGNEIIRNSFLAPIGAVIVISIENLSKRPQRAFKDLS